MTYDKPLPDVTSPLAAPFWAGLAARELRAQRCQACGTYRLPAAPLCPACLASGHDWVPVEAAGTLWSYVVYRRALDASFAADVPYAVGVVELGHGLHLLSRVAAPLDQLAVGDRMTARYDDVTPEVTLLTWVPEGGTA
jgi:uncharacterized OB-fold protein